MAVGERPRGAAAAAAAPAVPQLFRYFGSKARMAPALAEAVPEGTRVLVSPFFGSGAFEYGWAAAHPGARVVGYDLDPAVVNFHRAARTRRLALRARIGELLVRGPLPKRAYAAMVAAGLDRGLEGAARFYVVSQHSYGGKIGSYARPPRARPPLALEQPLPENVEVRLGDAHDVLAGLAGRPAAGTFVYMDPPYLIARRYYARSAGFDHARLAADARACGAPWLLSYNDSPDVRRLYRGFPRLSLPIEYNVLRKGAMITVQRAELLVSSAPLGAAARRRLRAAYYGAVRPARAP